MSAAHIIGIGQTAYSWAAEQGPVELAVEAALAAIADAGIPAGAIDGVIPFPIGPTAEDLISSLGLTDVSMSGTCQMGGASAVASLQLAESAIAAGSASCILVFVGKNGRSRQRIDQRVAQLIPGKQFRQVLEYPIGLNTPAQWYSLLCRRHMIEYGTSREQLGAVAVQMRENAQRNPGAMLFGKTLTLQQYLDSPPLADPYLRADCCLETDGAAAVIVSSADIAGDARSRPARILATATGRASSPDDIANRRPFLDTGLAHAAPRAFGRAGVQPSDISAAMVYDCFTFEVVHQLEAAGFCEEGAGGWFVETAGIGPSGRLPVNPHGGLLAEAHMSGMNHVLEAVRQLRGTAAERQLPDLELIAVTGWGDLGDGSIAILAAG
jgi:acetyl-CoA acetyltransferase